MVNISPEGITLVSVLRGFSHLLRYKCFSSALEQKINFRDLDIATSITGKAIETIHDRCNEIFNGVYNAVSGVRVSKTRISLLPIYRVIPLS